MRRRTLIILIAALVVGGITAYLAISYLGGQEEQEGAVQEEAVQVVVAARAMPAGHVLTTEDVRLVGWPADAVPPEYANSESDVVGRGLLAPISQNEPLLSTKLARMEGGGGLPILIPENGRAISISVDQVLGVAGFVLPGTRVDAVVIMEQPGTDEVASKIFLQNLQVLSIDQTYQREVEGEPVTSSVVTLLVTPEQAETLALARSQGIIQLALRNPLDTDSVSTDGALRAEVIDLGRRSPARPAQAAPSRPARFEVEVYRGPERSVTDVDTTGGDQ